MRGPVRQPVDKKSKAAGRFRGDGDAANADLVNGIEQGGMRQAESGNGLFNLQSSQRNFGGQYSRWLVF